MADPTLEEWGAATYATLGNAGAILVDLLALGVTMADVPAMRAKVLELQALLAAITEPPAAE